MKNDFQVKHLRYFFISALIILLNGCNSSDETKVDAGLKYFPLQVGNYWIYDVSETTFDTLIQNIELNYQEKYEIIDSFKNQLNEIAYVIHLSKRNNSSEAWETLQTWAAKISYINEIVVSEENVQYVKMIFPVKEGVSWRGNKYNTIEEDRNNSRVDNYVYENVNKPFENYASTITVQESNDLNLVYKDVRFSTYAENIGLVYRINNYIDYCNENSCLGLYLRKHEHTKIQTLVEHVIQ